MKINSEEPPLVSISCITYNHVHYIRQCLESIVMQKTNFVYEVLIHDDCSTDGTTEIIKEFESKYPDIIKPIYEKENQWVKGKKGSSVFNFPRAKGKYIAMCEGDDYWTDPDKLQKQVDILERNPQYSCCTHQTIINRDGKETNEFFSPLNANNNTYKLNDVLGDRHFHTASYLFRNTPYITNLPKVVSGDKLLILIIASIGDIFCLSDTMAVYRKTATGMSANVKFEDMKNDLNMIPYLKSMNHNFPVIKEKSYIYKTIALYSRDISLWNKLYYLSLYFVLSFSYFPRNIIEILRKLKGRMS